MEEEFFEQIDIQSDFLNQTNHVFQSQSNLVISKVDETKKDFENKIGKERIKKLEQIKKRKNLLEKKTEKLLRAERPFSKQQISTNSKEKKKEEHNEQSQISKVIEELKPFLNINSQFKNIPEGQTYLTPSELQKKLNQAIDEGKFLEAGLIHDEISKKEAKKDLMEAVLAKKFAEKKEKEEQRKGKNKRKLNWMYFSICFKICSKLLNFSFIFLKCRFEPKQRWERKGNM